MKILIIENEHGKKHKLWDTLCLVSENIELDFVEGDYDKLDGQSNSFTAISAEVKDGNQMRKLTEALKYFIKHFPEPKEIDDDDL